MKLSDKPIVNPEVVLREEFDDWGVLFHPHTSEAVGTGPVGVAIWKLLNGQRTLAEVAAQCEDAPDTVLEDTARLLLEELGLGSFDTNAAGYLGSCRVHADDVMLTTGERQVAMEALLRLTETHPGRIQASAGPLSEGRMWRRMWRRMEQARAQGAPPFPNGGASDRLRLPQYQDRRPRRRGHRPLLHVAPHRAGPHQPRLAGRGMAAGPSPQRPARAAHHPPDRVRVPRRLRVRALLHRQLPRPGLHAHGPGGPSEPRRLPAPLLGRRWED